VAMELVREPRRTLVKRTFKTPAGELSDLRQIPTAKA